MQKQEPVDIYLPEPKTTKSMLKLPQEVKNKFLQVVQNEYKNLINNETFALIEKPNDQDTVITTTMVFKDKSRSDVFFVASCEDINIYVCVFIFLRV